MARKFDALYSAITGAGVTVPPDLIEGLKGVVETQTLNDKVDLVFKNRGLAFFHALEIKTIDENLSKIFYSVIDSVPRKYKLMASTVAVDIMTSMAKYIETEDAEEGEEESTV